MLGNSPDTSIIYDARQKYLSLQIKGRECSLKIDMKNDSFLISAVSSNMVMPWYTMVGFFY